MLQVAICDDIQCERKLMGVRLKNFSEKRNITFNIQEFSSGEELIKVFKRQFDYT